MTKALYIHIPFCRVKCPYCDFYSIPHKEAIAQEYIRALCKQIDQLGKSFSTIYIGGGTPTVLEKTLLKQLLKSLERLISRGCEFTIEANPESLTKDKIAILIDGGLNRISIGAQSLLDSKLKKLSRIHSAKKVYQAITLAKKGGFSNISIDLIFGIWAEVFKEWQRELKEVVELPVTHISTYALTYERTTPLFKKLKQGKVSPLEEGAVASFYKFAIDYLPKNGFSHYEVSNFAKNGYRCQHNLNYWHNYSYFGLGACAVSFLEGVREKNIADVRGYIDKLERNLSPVVSKERLSKLRGAKETAALKVRTKQGIDFKWFDKHSGFSFRELESGQLDWLIDEGLIRYRRQKGQISGIYLTKKGFLFADTVSSSLL